MYGRSHLTNAELAAATHNFAQAKASLACEGIYLTAEEEALFRRFEDERLPHEERRRRIIDFCRAKQRARAAAAV